MVSLITDYDDPWSQKCGGALVASKYVVTSASCVHDLSPNEIFVMIGEHDFTRTEETEEKKYVYKIFPHEYYHASSKTHDIAVLELVTDVNLEEFTPICLAKTSDEGLTDGLRCQMYGYGKTGKKDGILHELDVTLVDNSKCSEDYEELITAGKVCAEKDNGKGACSVSFTIKW